MVRGYSLFRKGTKKNLKLFCKHIDRVVKKKSAHCFHILFYYSVVAISNSVNNLGTSPWLEVCLTHLDCNDFTFFFFFFFQMRELHLPKGKLLWQVGHTAGHTPRCLFHQNLTICTSFQIVQVFSQAYFFKTSFLQFSDFSLYEK